MKKSKATYYKLKSDQKLTGQKFKVNNLSNQKDKNLLLKQSLERIYLSFSQLESVLKFKYCESPTIALS